MRLGVDAAVVDGAMVTGDVAVADGVVVEVGLVPARSGRVAAPGLVDIQVNGYAGCDLLAADEAEVVATCRRLAADGVTAWQPTLITSAEADTLRALEVLERVAGQDHDGARILGVHLEGPFLAPERMGTHPVEHRREPDLPLLERLVRAGPVSRVTLAPELDGALALVDWLHEQDVVVSLGHSNASAAEAHAAFNRGVATVTHVFNAMRRFTPREPGIVGAALVRPDVVVQVIVDGHHLADDTVRLVWEVAGTRVALVTDAIAAAGLGDGSHRLGDVEVTVAEGAVRRADGTLAGSALTMLDAVRNCVALGIAPAAAIRAASTVPARVLRAGPHGRLEVAGPADLVVLDDRLELQRVLLAGKDAT